MTETAKDKTVTTYTLDFAYDAQGTPYSLTVTMQGISLTYYYITNLQGDVMYLVDKTGKQVVSYDYAPYGKIIGTNDYSTQTFAQIPTEPENTTKTIADLNPLRYRGYYYDTDDLGFYYLQSRYYDANICRFISADSYAITGLGLVGYNMFAYCNNEPINMFDGNGNVPQAVFDKLIHDEVLARICEQNDDLRYKETCIYYNGKDYRNGWGFCDLYNNSTGEVWELKKNSTSRSCTTAAASKQLAKYIAGRLKRNLGLHLILSYITNIQGGTFTKKTADYTYYVRYWNEGGGILRYDYQKFDNSYDYNFNIMPATIAAIAVACVYVAVAIFFPEALPPLLYGGGGGGMMVNMLY